MSKKNAKKKQQNKQKQKQNNQQQNQQKQEQQKQQKKTNTVKTVLAVICVIVLCIGIMYIVKFFIDRSTRQANNKEYGELYVQVTETPEATPTEEATAEPTAAPTAEPTEQATAEATPEPTTAETTELPTQAELGDIVDEVKEATPAPETTPENESVDGQTDAPAGEAEAGLEAAEASDATGEADAETASDENGETGTTGEDGSTGENGATASATSTDENSTGETADANGTETEPQAKPTKTAKAVRPGFEQLMEVNPDTVGVLTVGGIIVNQPVVQRDNTYYMDKNFEGETDKGGTLFMESMNVLSAEDNCLIVYGHNMADGTMFGNLHSMCDMEALSRHPLVTFNSIYEDAQYVPIAMFPASMQEDDSEYFNLRAMIMGESDITEYVKALKNRSWIYFPVDVKKTDKLLILVTCDYEETDGRFIFALRKLRDDETEAQAQNIVDRAQWKDH